MINIFDIQIWPTANSTWMFICSPSQKKYRKIKYKTIQNKTIITIIKRFDSNNYKSESESIKSVDFYQSSSRQNLFKDEIELESKT